MEQLVPDGLPKRKAKAARSYSAQELGRRQRDIELYDYLDSKYNVTIAYALPEAWEQVGTFGTVHTRDTYERVKDALLLEHGVTYKGSSSNLATVMTRRMVEADPNIMRFVTFRESGVDVVLARECKRDG